MLYKFKLSKHLRLLRLTILFYSNDFQYTITFQERKSFLEKNSGPLFEFFKNKFKPLFEFFFEKKNWTIILGFFFEKNFRPLFEVFYCRQ